MACIIFAADVPIPLANLQINIIAYMSAYKVSEKKVMSAAELQPLNKNNSNTN
jgi:hypothetical protein